MVDLHQLIDTVVTRSNHNIGASGFDLLGFDFAHFESALVVFAHGQHAATATAAEIVVAVGVHFNELGNRLFRHKTQAVEQTSISCDIAGVVDGVFFGVQRLVQLDFAAFDVFFNEFHQSDHFEARFVFQIVRGFPAQGSGTVATFA